MLKIQFTNAMVEDNGYGLSVNGEDLGKIISTALGSRLGTDTAYNSKLRSFKSQCCNVTVIIDPQPVSVEIETDEELWYSVEELEDTKREQFNEKTKAAES